MLTIFQSLNNFLVCKPKRLNYNAQETFVYHESVIWHRKLESGSAVEH